MNRSNFDSSEKDKLDHSDKLKGEISFVSLVGDPVEFGIRYLSSVLKKNGYKVNKIFLRLRLRDTLPERVAECINEHAKSSLFIGVSTMTDTVALANNLASLLC